MPELSNERLADIRNEYAELRDGLPSNLPDGSGAASAFYLSLSLGEVVSMASELQQRRASVVTPEMAPIGTFIASSEHGVGVQWGDLGPLKSGDKIYAALSVSHETGDGETQESVDDIIEKRASDRNRQARIAAATGPAPTDETQGVKRANSPPSKPLPDFDRLHGLFSYHAETGKIIWEVPFKAIVAGDEAGSVWNDGYRYIRLDGRVYLAHRIAWLMHYGEAPKRALDHINGVKSDNRISNLRQATIAENNRNRPRPRNNTSGHKGVTLNSATGKFIARIGHNRTVHSLGYFDTAAEAAAAYAAKAKELHGEFHHDQ